MARAKACGQVCGPKASPVRRRQERRIEPIGAADQEHQATHPTVAQRRDLLGEGARGPGLAVFVTGDDPFFPGGGLGQMGP